MNLNDLRVNTHTVRMSLTLAKEELNQLVSIGICYLLQRGDIHSDQSSFSEIEKTIEIRNNKVFYSGNTEQGVALEDVLEIAISSSLGSLHHILYCWSGRT